MLQSKPSDSSGGASSFSLTDLSKANPVQPILDAAGNIDKILDPTFQINKFASDFARNIGAGDEYTKSIQTYLALSAQDLTNMGAGAEGAAIATQLMQEYMTEFGRNTIISQKSMQELYKNSKVLDVSTKDLLTNFASIGKEIPSISEYTKIMAVQARSFGVPLSQVADDVIPELGKLNEFGFNNGIEGLAKMSIQSRRLKISMSETFSLAEDLFSPEKALETAAFFQRMGVVNAELTDAFALQDIARNRVDDLQTAIADMASTFLEFDEETQQFKVPPSSVDDLRVISQQTGIAYQDLVRSGGELLKMQSRTKQLSDAGLEYSDSQIQQLESMMQLLPSEEGGLSYQVTFTTAGGETVTEEIDKLTATQRAQLQQFLIQSEDINRGSKEFTDNLFTEQQSVADKLAQTQKANQDAISNAVAATGGPDILNAALSVYQATSSAFLNNFSLSNNDFKTFLNGFNTNLQGVVTSLSNADLTGAMSNLSTAASSLVSFAGTAGLGTLTDMLSNLTTSLGSFSGVDFSGFQTQLEAAKTAVENFTNSFLGITTSAPPTINPPEINLPEGTTGPTSQNNQTNVNGRVELIIKSDGAVDNRIVTAVVGALGKRENAQKLGMDIIRAFDGHIPT
jgi:hypothetical protein